LALRVSATDLGSLQLTPAGTDEQRRSDKCTSAIIIRGPLPRVDGIAIARREVRKLWFNEECIRCSAWNWNAMEPHRLRRRTQFTAVAPKLNCERADLETA
jgi:hypothetical protein